MILGTLDSAEQRMQEDGSLGEDREQGPAQEQPQRPAHSVDKVLHPHRQRLNLRSHWNRIEA